MAIVEFITFWVSASWDFFTEINVPGFDFSIASLFVGVFLASLGLRFILSMLGITAAGKGDKKEKG